MLGHLLQSQEAILVELEEPALVKLHLELLSSGCLWQISSGHILVYQWGQRETPTTQRETMNPFEHRLWSPACEAFVNAPIEVATQDAILGCC